MKRALLLFVLPACAALATLAGCGPRQSAAPTAHNDARKGGSNASPNNTAAMGAGPASASAPSAPSAPLAPAQVARVAEPSQQDIAAGRGIATQGAPGAAACSSCHGANGEGNAQAGFPRLAAQGRLYIEHQLNSYADGTRANQVMTPIAGALSAQQRAQVAGFYASLGTSTTASANTSAQSAPSNAQAPALVVHGDEKRGVQACANCHGPQGIGDAAANPYLAGQNQPYLVAAIAEWKSGVRHNDPSGQMPAIAKALTDDESRALGAYFAKLPAPAPRNSQAAAATVNATRAAVQSGPVAPTAPSQGTGTQQGAPLTGGSQGQGSGGAATNPGQTTR